MTSIQPPPEFADPEHPAVRWREDHPIFQEAAKSFSIFGYENDEVHWYPTTEGIYIMTADMAEAVALALIEAAKIARGLSK